MFPGLHGTSTCVTVSDGHPMFNGGSVKKDKKPSWSFFDLVLSAEKQSVMKNISKAGNEMGDNKQPGNVYVHLYLLGHFCLKWHLCLMLRALNECYCSGLPCPISGLCV